MAGKLKILSIDGTGRTVDLYKAGTNITFGEAGTDGKIPINSSVDTSNFATKTELNAKQDTLTAGTNITISGSTISATDTTYTAGDGIKITGTSIALDLTKAQVLTALGYEEITLKMTDDAGTESTWTVLAKE